MRNYGIVSPMFWIGKTGRKLRENPDAQRVAMYLITAPTSEMCGVFYCPLSYILNDLGPIESKSDKPLPSPLQGVSEVLEYLQKVGFCFYDFENEWVFVYEMAKWQIGEKLTGGDKRISGVRKDVQSMPEPMKSMFLARYNEAFSLGFETPPPAKIEVENHSPSEGACKPHRSQEQEQEQEQEQDQYTNKQSTEVEAIAPKPTVDCLIDKQEIIFDSDDTIDAPIQQQVENAQLEALNVSDENRPLTIIELVTTAKTYGIKVARNARTEAITDRKTITLAVFRECVKRWKGTNTSTGYFVAILENASKDPACVMPRPKDPPLSAETITDKQAGYFASKLVKDQGFCSKFGQGFSDYPAFISKVAANLRNPRHFEDYRPFMEKYGFVRPVA